MKYCPKCDTKKDESNFYRNPKSRDGLQSYCKDCEKETQRASRLKAGMQPRTGRPKRHVHTHAAYMDGCLKCRNNRRWEEYKKTRPIICKSGHLAPQASFA